MLLLETRTLLPDMCSLKCQVVCNQRGTMLGEIPQDKNPFSQAEVCTNIVTQTEGLLLNSSLHYITQQILT